MGNINLNSFMSIDLDFDSENHLRKMTYQEINILFYTLDKASGDLKVKKENRKVCVYLQMFLSEVYPKLMNDMNRPTIFEGQSLKFKEIDILRNNFQNDSTGNILLSYIIIRLLAGRISTDFTEANFIVNSFMEDLSSIIGIKPSDIKETIRKKLK